MQLHLCGLYSLILIILKKDANYGTRGTGLEVAAIDPSENEMNEGPPLVDGDIGTEMNDE